MNTNVTLLFDHDIGPEGVRLGLHPSLLAHDGSGMLDVWLQDPRQIDEWIDRAQHDLERLRHDIKFALEGLQQAAARGATAAIGSESPAAR